MSLLGNSVEANNILGTMQNNTHLRKSVYNPYTKKFQPKHRKRIFQVLQARGMGM